MAEEATPAETQASQPENESEENRIPESRVKEMVGKAKAESEDRLQAVETQLREERDARIRLEESQKTTPEPKRVFTRAE